MGFGCHGVATVSRIDQIIGLFCRISPVLQGSSAKETYNFIDPTSQSHPMGFVGLFIRVKVSFHMCTLPWGMRHTSKQTHKKCKETHSHFVIWKETHVHFIMYVQVFFHLYKGVLRLFLHVKGYFHMCTLPWRMRHMSKQTHNKWKETRFHFVIWKETHDNFSTYVQVYFHMCTLPWRMWHMSKKRPVNIRNMCRTQSFTHSLTHSLTFSLSHSVTQSLIHSVTHIPSH